MSKLYWRLRQSMSRRDRRLYVVISNRRRAKAFCGMIRTYPNYRWGYGWHIRGKKL